MVPKNAPGTDLNIKVSQGHLWNLEAEVLSSRQQCCKVLQQTPPPPEKKKQWVVPGNQNQHCRIV